MGGDGGALMGWFNSVALKPEVIEYRYVHQHSVQNLQPRTVTIFDLRARQVQHPFRSVMSRPSRGTIFHCSRVHAYSFLRRILMFSGMSGCRQLSDAGPIPTLPNSSERHTHTYKCQAETPSIN